MKMTIVLLVVLGLAAAMCAVLLINALDVAGMRSARNKSEVSVVKVTKALPAMTILSEEMLKVETRMLTETPQGYYTNPAQVLGKVLSLRMVEGEILTSNKIVRGGSSAELAATLPDGMRAVSVTLQGSQISGGMLYPGCMVDVLVAFSLGSSEKGDALSTTMLEMISVLAVQGESVVSKQNPDKEKGETPKVNSRSSRGATVTLMVNTNQAEALQLAAMNGRISLTLRNPLDKLPQEDDATVLNRGKLGRLGSLMGTTVKSKPGDSTKPGESANQSNTSGEQTSSSLLGGVGDSGESDGSSEVMVIRGSKISYDEVEATDEAEPTEGTQAEE